MSDFKERLVTEQKELVNKLNKLESFVHSNKFDGIKEPHRSLLIVQIDIMNTYNTILYQRIKLLKE